MATTEPSIHASAVLIGAKAVLIRGPSGSGKSTLAWRLMEAADQSSIPFSRLVADDRSFVEARAGRLLVRPAPELAGLIEVRGLGIRKTTYEPVAVVGLVIDLGAPDAARLPSPEAENIVISGISLPRLAIPAGINGRDLILAAMATRPGNT